VKDILIKNKEFFAGIFVIFTACILIFYWTHKIFNYFSSNISSETRVITEKILKAEILSQKIKSSQKSSGHVIKTSLLAFMQNKTANLGLEDKLIILKPKTDLKGIEGAVLRFERFNLNDFITLIELLDKYENIKIDSFIVTKRFDNPKLVNLNMEIYKIK
jgi:hypothetical protein